MFSEIVVTSTSFSKNKLLMAKLQKMATKVRGNDQGVKLQGQDLVSFIGSAEVAVVGLEGMGQEVLEKLPNLQYIGKYGVGLDNIDLDYCKEKKIQIGWEPGTNKRSVAELVLGNMLVLLRNIYQSSMELKAGSWNKNGGYQLTRKKIGIIGIGHIGKDLVKLLAPFECEILVNDIFWDEDFISKWKLVKAAKEEIYQNCDFITVHLPLTQETKNLIGMKEFKMMKSSSFVINTARGGIINQQDLETALDQKLIAGAGLDVYESEPLTQRDKSLYQRKNVLCTPHIGGNSAEAVMSMGMSVIKFLERISKDE